MSVKITNIYLGANFEKNNDKIKAEIREACKRNNVLITQMSLSVTDYSVKVNK